MDPQPGPSELRRRLRAARTRELAAATPEGSVGLPPADEHRVSLTQVHDNVLAVLARIDGAEDGMRPVLRAWAYDPARRGAHLLGDAHAESATLLADEPQPTVTWPVSLGPPTTQALGDLSDEDSAGSQTIPLPP